MPFVPSFLRRPWLSLVAVAWLGCASPPPTPTEVVVPKTTESTLVTPVASTPTPEVEAASPTLLPNLTLKSADKADMIPELEGWLSALPSPLRLSWTGAELRYDPRAKSHQLRHDGWRLFVGFDGPAQAAPTADELGKRFAYWGLDAATVPIEAEGWSFFLRTPQSSSSEGFEVVSYRDGVARLVIEGTFYALRGEHEETGDCRLMADAPAPDPCWVSVERSIPFELVVEATVVD